VLHCAALVGTAVDAQLLCRLVDADDAELDAVLLTGLLAVDGTDVRFRHEIARQAVEESVPAYRRRLWHVRILAAFEAAGGADDAVLAFHAEQASDSDAVARYAPRAAERAARLASRREAVAQYVRALRAGAADEATRARWFEGLARESRLIDRWRACLDAETSALALWRALGDRLREGDAMQRLAHVYWNLGRGAESLEVAEAAVARLEPLGSTVELARALATLAAKYMTHDRSADAIAVARRTQQMAVRFDAFDVQSAALNSEGCAASCLGDDWLGPLLASLELAREHDLPDHAARAYANIWGIAGDQRRFAEFADLYREGVAFCDEREMDTHGRFLRAGQVNALFYAGRWAESLALARQLLAAGDKSLLNTITALSRSGSIGARRGHPGSQELLDEAWQLAADNGEPQYIVPVLAARAEACWLAGDADAARVEALRAVSIASPDAWLRGEAAAWCHRLGAPVADPCELHEPYALEIAGDWQRAAAWWTAHACPYDAAVAQLGSTDEAGIRAALNAFIALGATAAARLARRQLRVLGARSVPVGPRRATQAHPSGLTPRQQDVLTLLAAGSSNADIAAKLFISVKTVDHHVSAILSRLDVTTRHAAVGKAAQLGLVDASRA
jgi:DNA-binding CsgD family transcriptional regulator